MENKENKPKFRPNPSLKLMDQVREVLRYHHYAYRTESTYGQWILRYVRFYGGKTHPKLLGAGDVWTKYKKLSLPTNIRFPIYDGIMRPVIAI
jgi:hypothetical protein